MISQHLTVCCVIIYPQLQSNWFLLEKDTKVTKPIDKSENMARFSFCGLFYYKLILFSVTNGV
jgi:hypothetical protein